MFNWFKKKKSQNKDGEESSEEKEEETPDAKASEDGSSEPASADEENSATDSDRKLEIISVEEKSKSDSALTSPDHQNSENAPKPKGREGALSDTSVEIPENMSDSDMPSNKYSIKTFYNLHKSADFLNKSEEKPESILKTKSEGNVRYEPSDVDKSVTFDEENLETGTGQEYTFDDAVDMIGYGRFQRVVTFLTGLGWFAESYAIIITSILQDFLACDWTLYMWQVAALTSAMFVGMMCGAPVFGVVADIWGRRRALAISMVIAFVFGCTSAAAPSPEWMMASRALMGFALGSLAQGVTLCIEFYPVKDRGIAGFYINYYWCVGNATLILVAWLIIETTHLWRLLVFVAAFPCIIAFISMKWYPESVRYYMVSNQYEKAVDQLEKLAASNKVALPNGTLKMTYADKEESMGNIMDMLKPPHTLTTLLYWYIWFAVSFHYYGLALVNPVIIKQGKIIVSPEESAHAAGTNLTHASSFFTAVYPCHEFSTDNYLDLFWTGCAEIPGIVIYPFLVKCIARKKLLASSVLTNSIMVLFLLIDFKSDIPAKIIIFFCRTNSGGFYQLIMIMTGEAFPTTLRATSLGSSHAFSMFGAALVPFAAQILIINQPVIAMCLISGAVFLVAIAATLLPREMKDVPIKDFSEQFYE